MTLIATRRGSPRAEIRRAGRSRCTRTAVDVDRLDSHLEHVAGLRAVHVDRAGEYVPAGAAAERRVVRRRRDRAVRGLDRSGVEPGWSSRAPHVDTAPTITSSPDATRNTGVAADRSRRTRPSSGTA